MAGFLIIAAAGILAMSCSRGPAAESSLTPASISSLAESTPYPALTGNSQAVTAANPQMTEDLPPAMIDVETETTTDAAGTTTGATVTATNATETANQTNINDYRLTIDGLVDTPLTFTYESILQYPSVTKRVLLDCPGFFTENNEWTMVPLEELLSQVGLQPSASKVIFHASDSMGGYKVELPLSEITRDGVYLAYLKDGQVLTYNDGYPLRIVVTEMIGQYWVKWLDHIEIQ
jgi:DMSO/TMAO reductase YedYZ molybdopterin-dependent catalytic subunit